MKKWLIGLGAIILLFVVLDIKLSERDWAPLRKHPSLCQAHSVTGQFPDAWVQGLGASRRRRPYRNPLRRQRLSKKERRLLRRRRSQACRRSGADALVTLSDSSAAQPASATERMSQEVKTGGTDQQKGVQSGAHSTPAVTGPTPGEPVKVRRRRGRPAIIPTDHVFCPDQACQGYGQVGPHPDHHIVGCGTYRTASGSRQLYRCQLCRRVFSETQGTVFFGLKTPQETVYRALACLSEGLGIRATARVFGVKPDDVLRWLRRGGQHCETVSAYLMRNLHVQQAQLDELWTFVRQKEKTLSAWEQMHTEYGDTWVWTVFDPVCKLVLAIEVGEREEAQAVSVLQRLKGVLVEGCLPLLTSDQLPHYAQAILQVFGRWVQPARRGTRGRFPKPRLQAPDDLQYATVHKERQGQRVVSVSRQIVFGRAEQVRDRLRALGVKQVNTSFVERMNLTLRHLVCRFKRRGLNFSKKRDHLVWHLQLAVGYYHFVRPHGRLRQRLIEPKPTTGTPQKWEQRTPAMAAGLTDHIWTMQELLMYRVPPQVA